MRHPRRLHLDEPRERPVEPRVQREVLVRVDDEHPRVARGAHVREGRLDDGVRVDAARGRPLDAVHVVLKDAIFCVFPVAWAMFAPRAAPPALAALALLSYFLAGHFVARRALKAAPRTPSVVDAVPSPLGDVTRFGASRPRSPRCVPALECPLLHCGTRLVGWRRTSWWACSSAVRLMPPAISSSSRSRLRVGTAN